MSTNIESGEQPGSLGRNRQRLGIFSCIGIELEYMIVDQHDLKVRPISDRILMNPEFNGSDGDVVRGQITWSNEIVRHVLELKGSDPFYDLNGVGELFHTEVQEINSHLGKFGAQLVGSAMHPLMSPQLETELWPFGHNSTYQKFDEIFNCKGHGWSNLQSVHINLPFSSDSEFRRLHSAIRIVLPILPALAASSPIVDGVLTGKMDSRLHYYLNNSVRVPSVCGECIPEVARSEAEYQKLILQPIAKDLAPLDPEGVLEPEFTNSRGAIARFERGSIEIRLLDIQECPRADVAIVALVASLVRELARSDIERLEQLSTSELRLILLECINFGRHAIIRNSNYLECLNLPPTAISAEQVWRSLASRQSHELTAHAATLESILSNGTLAERMTRRLTSSSSNHSSLKDLYRNLASCLAANELFLA